MASLAQFSKNIRRRGRQVENSASRIVRQTASTYLRTVVKATPVDKGVARSNWRVGIGAPTRSVIGAYAPGKKLGIGESANASAAINAGLTRIASARGVSGVGLKTAIYISNNVKYIEKLNDGSSTQAPAGFIDRANLAVRMVISNFRVFIN